MHVYTNRKVDKPDLEGMKIRGVPNFRNFFTRLNGNMVTIPPGEVYTALERGVVEGYGWPIMGIFDLGWQEQTKYRVDPGFYNVEVSIVFNLAAWRRLTPAQREFLETQRAWLEKTNLEIASRDIVVERARQQAAGIQVLRFSPADEARYVKLANDGAWDSVMEASPKYGAALRERFGPK